MTQEPSSAAQLGYDGSGLPPGPGGPGGGAGDSGRFMAQMINRLNNEGITADRAFLSELQDFLNEGLDRSRREGSGIGDVESRWPQVVTTVIEYATDNGLRHLNARAFDGIRERLCPGFWPFC